VPTSFRPAPRGFGEIETWVFDLDNTLYPHHLNLWQQVDDRIRSYVADFLKVSKDEAFRVQKDYYKRYGTTMRGMMAEHGMKPDDYLDYVHQIDHSPLTPNPALGAALERLPGRKLILTNGTRKHADTVMKRLAVHEHFEAVFDIVAADLEPKPSARTYERFLEATSLSREAAADVLQIPARTLNRRREEGRLHADESDRLLRVARLFARALELCEGDESGARTWLTSPADGLGGATPLEYASTEVGALEVDALIGRIEHGIPS